MKEWRKVEEYTQEVWGLYFEVCNEEKCIIAISQDLDYEDIWNYTSNFLKVEIDDFQADSLEEAKEEAEYLVTELINDQIYYWESMLKDFEEN